MVSVQPAKYSNGTNASGDLVITTDTGTDTANFIDLGINSSGYNNATYNSGGANDAYLLVNGGSLSIIAESANKNIGFYSGGGTTNNEKMMIKANGDVTIGDAPLPVAGTAGFFYISGMTGIPTGVPTTYAGRIPMTIDYTNDNFYMYTNGVWRKFTEDAYQYAESDAQSSTNSTAYVNKVRLTTTSLTEGTYRIGWSYCWQIAATNAQFQGRVRVDNTTVIYLHIHRVSNANTAFLLPASGFKQYTFTAGSHTIDIDYSSSSAASTAFIQYARIELDRV